MGSIKHIKNSEQTGIIKNVAIVVTIAENDKIKGCPTPMTEYNEYRESRGFRKSNKENCSFGAACFFRDVYSFNPYIVQKHDMGDLYAISENVCHYCDDAKYWPWETVEIDLPNGKNEMRHTRYCGKFEKELTEVEDSYTHQLQYVQRVRFHPFAFQINCPMANRLNQLLSYKDPALSKQFMENIRKVSTTLLFASTIVDDNLINQKLSHGPPTMMVQGNIVHKMGSLDPPGDKARQYAQTYNYENIQAIERLHDYFKFSDGIKGIVEELRGYIAAKNSFAVTIQNAYKGFEEQDKDKIFIRTELIDAETKYDLIDNEQIRAEVAAAPPRTHSPPTV